ncbi:hypothetical protein EDD86DRAFT_145665 [Gorgonomyces haynaldii]|nr:hypothetical protein EDD86DRAFT_145665 [Gorgonomyces haynaldii]
MDGPTRKKQKVEEEEDDEDLTLKKKKNRVQTDVYSDDDADFVDSDQSEPEQEDSMFDERKTKLEKNDIEGQEWGQSEEKMMPFNLDQEMEEGEFNVNGSYVLKKEELAVHDQWLHGIDKTQMEKAKTQKELLEKRSKAMTAPALDEGSLYRQLLPYMIPGDTIPKTLARLRGPSKWKKKKEPVDEKKKQDLEQVSAITSKLFDVDVNCYDKTFEQIVKLLIQKKLLAPDWQYGTPLDQEQVKQVIYYEYKWGIDSTGTWIDL